VQLTSSLGKEEVSKKKPSLHPTNLVNPVKKGFSSSLGKEEVSKKKPTTTRQGPPRR